MHVLYDDYYKGRDWVILGWRHEKSSLTKKWWGCENLSFRDYLVLYWNTTMCQDTLSEPASVQIHLFFKFNIVSWFNFCLCAYSHRFFRNNSVIQIQVFAFGTLLLAWVFLKSHLCSSSISASTSVDLCRDTSDTTQICCDTSDTTQKLSVYLWKIVKMSVYLR